MAMTTRSSIRVKPQRFMIDPYTETERISFDHISLYNKSEQSVYNRTIFFKL